MSSVERLSSSRMLTMKKRVCYVGLLRVLYWRFHCTHYNNVYVFVASHWAITLYFIFLHRIPTTKPREDLMVHVGQTLVGKTRPRASQISSAGLTSHQYQKVLPQSLPIPLISNLCHKFSYALSCQWSFYGSCALISVIIAIALLVCSTKSGLPNKTGHFILS